METNEHKTREGFYGWINVIILFLVYASLYGFVFYGFTVVFPAMIKAEGWGRGEAALAHTIRGFLLGFLAPLASYCIVRFGSRRTMAFGLGIGVLVMGALGSMASQLWHWILLWGFIMPFSFSLGGAIPIQTTVTYWFSNRRATVMGMVLTGAAAAGFISAPLFTAIMDSTGTWKTGWLTAAGFCALAFVASFFIKNKPEDLGQFPDGIRPEKTTGTVTPDTSKKATTYRTKDTWTLKEALKVPAIYLLMICMIAQISALYLFTVHGVLHLMDSGFTKMQAASVIGNLILFSGIARFPMGVLGDRFEPRWIITASLAVMGITFIWLWKAPANLPLLLAMGSVFGFCFGATVVMFPTIIGNYFSPSLFATINGFLQPFMIFAGAPIPLVAGLIHDRLHSYDIIFIYVIILLFAATLCALLLAPPSKKTS